MQAPHRSYGRHYLFISGTAGRLPPVIVRRHLIIARPQNERWIDVPRQERRTTSHGVAIRCVQQRAITETDQERDGTFRIYCI